MKRGPRFTQETTEETARRIQDAAVRLVTEQGLGGLSFRALARSPGLSLAPSAPLHYFGTLAGLLGAIAERGFDELAARLQNVRESAAPSARTLERIAAAHGRFGLEKPRLYQAIHAARLWQSAGRTSAKSGAMEKAKPWLERATSARANAFNEYILAVANGQRAGAIRKHQPGEVAHVLTTLVDGFLFQVVEEQIMSEWDVEEQAAYLSSLIRLVIIGLRSTPR